MTNSRIEKGDYLMNRSNLFRPMKLVSMLLLSLCSITGIYAQTWEYLGARWCVSVTSDMSLGYSGTTRVLYLAAKRDSLLKSTGSTIYWVNDTQLANADFVTCLFRNPDVVYAGVNNVGVSKSTSGGNSWTQINNGLTNLKVVRLAISPFDVGRLYVGAVGIATQQPTDVALFKSTDGGTNWTAVGQFASLNMTVNRIVFDPDASSSNYIYVAGPGTDGGVWRSSDGGGAWLHKNQGITVNDISNVLSLGIAPAPQSNILYVGTHNGKIYKTTNRGDNWTQVYSSSGRLINDLRVDPAQASTIYAATSQGVLKSTDSGTNWVSMNDGIQDFDVRAIVPDPGWGQQPSVGPFMPEQT